MFVKQCIWRGNGIFLSIVALMSLHCFGAQEQKIFCGETVELLERAYSEAPFRAQWAVNRMATKKRSLNPSNYAILDGKTGVGKTTLAIAMAHKLQWEVHKFHAIDFLRDSERGKKTVEVFNNVVDTLDQNDTNQVFIVDDVDCLLKYRRNDTFDTNVLWSFLHKIRNRPNIFFIGTTCEGLPCDFPSSFTYELRDSLIKMEPEKNLNRTKQRLVDGLQKSKIIVADQALCYLDANISFLEGYTHRSIKNLISIVYEKLSEYAQKKGYDKKIVLVEHLKAAFEELADIKREFNEKPNRPETKYEQKERRHKELLANQEQIHRMNLQMHKNVASNNFWSGFALGTSIGICCAAIIWLSSK